MKTSNPYGPGMDVKMPPDTINQELSKASSKATAKYTHKPLGPGQSLVGGTGIKHRAMTPGTSPTGS